MSNVVEASRLLVILKLALPCVVKTTVVAHGEDAAVVVGSVIDAAVASLSSRRRPVRTADVLRYLPTSDERRYRPPTPYLVRYLR